MLKLIFINTLLAVLTEGQLLVFYLVLFASFLFLFFYFYFTFFRQERGAFPSPYTGVPLRYAREIPYWTQEKVTEYLKSLEDFENRPFDFSKASFCRDTGRIFPESINWRGVIVVDSYFLNKRYKGGWVSWGSVPKPMQEAIRKAHSSLKGFQTEFSSSEPIPRLIEEKFAYASPGPLYVDPSNGILLGWKRVPGTDVEVLIVQRPVRILMLQVEA